MYKFKGETMIYNRFSNYYDKLTYDVDYDSIVQFYNKVFSMNNCYPRSILELGCGTGNITSRLNGYNVYAVDLSEEMLGIAREKMSNRRNVNFFHMDMRDFKFSKKFDVVISALDSINYILSFEDLLTVFKNVYKHLNDEGLFIFDINSYFKISHKLANNTFTDEVDDTLYIWQSEFHPDTSICEYALTFFVETKEGLYERFSESHSERAYSNNEITELLKTVGFDKINIYDGFSIDKPREDSDRISFVAVKKE